MAEAEGGGVGAAGARNAMGARRDELLLKMYDQMFSDINRHILVVWQSVGVLVGAFSLFSLVERELVPLDIASALMVLLAGWLVAHLYDAAYWYNRNLVIIANIERQFLRREDLHEIQYYFGAHRPDRMFTHLRIQYALAVGLSGIVLVYHFCLRVLPYLGPDWRLIQPAASVPYLTLLVAGFYLERLRRQRAASYAEFVRNSPGIDVETIGVSYGVGHGFEASGGR